MSPGLEQLMARIDRDVGAGATRVPFEALDLVAARSLVQNITRISPEIAEHVVKGAAGLPFYMVQPVHVWIETGALQWSDGAWTRIATAGVDPMTRGFPGLGELVDARIRAFFDADGPADRAAQYSLACLSADGAATPRRRLSEVLRRLDVDDALAARVLEALLSAAVVVERDGGGLAIPQPIVAEALLAMYARRAWWRSLLGAVLAALEVEPEKERDCEKLARGFDLLGEGNVALGWYRAAMIQRMRQGAFDDLVALATVVAAREQTEAGRCRAEIQAVVAMQRDGAASVPRERHRAIHVPDDEGLALEWTVLGEELAAAAGDATATDLDGLVHRADALGDPRIQVMARMALAGRRRGRAGRAALQEALAVMDPDPAGASSNTRYRLLALDVELVYETKEGGLDEVRAAVARARDAARALGSTWAELDAENDLAIVEADMGDPEGAIVRLAGVSERAARSHHGSLRRLALTNAAALELGQGRAPIARAHAVQAGEDSRAAGDARFLAVALSIRAGADLAMGDPAAALQAISECITLREKSGETNIAIAMLRRADARAQLGDAEGARADAELAALRARTAENIDHEALARLWLGLDSARRTSEGLIALRALADSLALAEPRLRPPTLRKLAEARALLAASS